MVGPDADHGPLIDGYLYPTPFLCVKSCGCYTASREVAEQVMAEDL